MIEDEDEGDTGAEDGPREVEPEPVGGELLFASVVHEGIETEDAGGEPADQYDEQDQSELDADVAAVSEDLPDDPLTAGCASS